LVQEENGADVLVILNGATPPLKIRDVPTFLKNHPPAKGNADNEILETAGTAGFNHEQQYQYQAIVALLLQELLPQNAIKFDTLVYRLDYF